MAMAVRMATTATKEATAELTTTEATKAKPKEIETAEAMGTEASDRRQLPKLAKQGCGGAKGRRSDGAHHDGTTVRRR